MDAGLRHALDATPQSVLQPSHNEMFLEVDVKASDGTMAWEALHGIDVLPPRDFQLFDESAAMICIVLQVCMAALKLALSLIPYSSEMTLWMRSLDSASVRELGSLLI